MISNDEFFMQRCIQLAYLGLGSTYPNPLVGSVIVDDNKIVGEGWHYKSGSPHAEVNAFKSLRNKKLSNSAKIYVSLEPCAHFGKTPPCVDLIINSGIKHVIIGALDYNKKVNGKGIGILRENGIEVRVGVLKDACEDLNKRFFTFHKKKRPYVILKWAQTQDGFIDKERINCHPTQNWISNPLSKQIVHQWRAEEQAILVGTNTVLNDNPKLNVREIKGGNPIRIIIDKKLTINPTDFHVFDENQKTIVFNELISKENKNISLFKINFKEKVLPQILEKLHLLSIQSLIIEGGLYTLNQFIEENLWDESRVINSTIKWNIGLKAPKISALKIHSYSILNDEVTIYKNI